MNILFPFDLPFERKNIIDLSLWFNYFYILKIILIFFNCKFCNIKRFDLKLQEKQN